MYLQEKFKECDYNKIINSLKNTDFEFRLEIGKLKFRMSITDTKESEYSDIWDGEFIVGLKWDYGDGGRSWAEKTTEFMKKFNTYDKACEFIHEGFKNYVSHEPKYKGLQTCYQMSLL